VPNGLTNVCKTHCSYSHTFLNQSDPCLTMFETKHTLENSNIPSKLDIVKYTKCCEYYFGSAEFIEGTDGKDVSRNPTLC